MNPNVTRAIQVMSETHTNTCFKAFKMSQQFNVEKLECLIYEMLLIKGKRSKLIDTNGLVS